MAQVTIFLSLKEISRSVAFERQIFAFLVDNTRKYLLGISICPCLLPGMVVMTMTAVDYDDPSEGTNAKLIYSIEKNVIEEETGSPIFEIESETGVIKTAVCCLDRERTPDYSIQVVAMDGGGLKGKLKTKKNAIFVREFSQLFAQIFPNI